MVSGTSWTNASKQVFQSVIGQYKTFLTPRCFYLNNCSTLHGSYLYLLSIVNTKQINIYFLHKIVSTFTTFLKYKSSLLESSSKNLPQIYRRFTNHLPMIYQRFTKNKKIFGILLSKYLPRIYQ